MDSYSLENGEPRPVQNHDSSTFFSRDGSIALHVGKLPSSFLLIFPLILPSAMIAVLPKRALVNLNVDHGQYITINKRFLRVFAAEALLPESDDDGVNAGVLPIALFSPCLFDVLSRNQKVKNFEVETAQLTLLESVALKPIIPNPLPPLHASRVASLAKRSILGRDAVCGDIFPVSSNVWLEVDKVQGLGVVGKDTNVAIALGSRCSRTLKENLDHMRAWACSKWREAVSWDLHGFSKQLSTALDEHASIILLEGMGRDVEDVLRTVVVGRTIKWVRNGTGKDLTEAFARCELADGGAIVVEHIDNDMKETIRIWLAQYEGQWAYLPPVEDKVSVVVCTENRDDLDREILQSVEIDIAIPKALEKDRKEVLMQTIATERTDYNASDIEELVRLSTGFARREVHEIGKLFLNRGMNACREAVKYFEKGKLSVDSGGITWADIGGLDEPRKQILDLVDSYNSNPLSLSPSMGEETSHTKLSNRRVGLLLYGPPGTGKTLLARAVANECGCSFIAVKGPELLDMYVGESEKNVRKVFERAMVAAPCVIFFDELDALAPSRGRGSDSGGVSDRVVSQLLSELDLVSSRRDIFVIAATNRPDLIDSGLLRPGRLDKMVYVPMPQTREEQVTILKAQTAKFLFADDVDLDKALSHAPEPPALSGADIYAMASDAWMSAAKRTVSESMTEKAVENTSIKSTQSHVLLTDSPEETEEYDMYRDWFSGESEELEDATAEEEPLRPKRLNNDKSVIVTQSDLVRAAERLQPSLSASQLYRYEELRRTLESGQ